MYRRPAALLFATALLGFAGEIARYARGAVQVPAADQPLSHEERVRLLATGKELFLARCARCHDERGDKPLKTGSPFHERRLHPDEASRERNRPPPGKTREGGP